jgi:parallel beta-helix repeat protein
MRLLPRRSSASLRIITLSIISCAIFISQVCATEYFVAQNRPGASDFNAGTALAPLKTIGAGINKLKAGDKLTIHEGEYREMVIMRTSGTAAQPILIEAAPGERVVIKGSDLVSGWRRDGKSTAVYQAKLPPLPQKSPDSRNPTYWAFNDVRQVFARDGVLLDAVPLKRVLSRSAMKPGTFYYNAGKMTLYVQLANNANPAKYKIEASLRTMWLHVEAEYVTVRGIQMRHSNTMALGAWPAAAISGKYNVVEGCTFTWGEFIGVSLNGSNHELVNCVIACNGNSGVSGMGSNHLIEGCRVVYNNLDRYDPNWHCGGAKLIPGFSFSTIIGNEFAHNVGPGVWLDGASNNNRIEANLCHNNEGAGIMVEISKDNIICNNISYSNRNYAPGSYLTPDWAAFARGLTNVFTTRHVAPPRTLGIYEVYLTGEGRGIFIASAPQTRVFNNTCYGNEGEGICAEGANRQFNGESMAIYGTQIFNNISAYNKGAQLNLPTNGSAAYIYANISDHNLLYAEEAVLVMGGWGSHQPFWSLTEWQLLTGRDKNSLASNPSFASELRLAKDSPAIGKATPIQEVSADFAGTPRNQTSPTIGAFEVPLP